VARRIHARDGNLKWVSLLMWAGAVAWQIGYDTAYAYVDVRDDFAILIFQGRPDNHEDHCTGSSGFFIYFHNARCHRDSIAGTNGGDEIDLHAGR